MDSKEQTRTQMQVFTTILSALIVCWLSTTASAQRDPAWSFSRDVRPILSRRCFPCHGPDGHSRKVDLDLHTFESATRERKGGATIVPGNARDSLLMQRILQQDEDLRMPPAEMGERLTEREVSVLEQWIESGAEYQPHWAFLRPDPTLMDLDHDLVDRELEAAAGAMGLQIKPLEDAWILARRLAFDLTGLPPTLEQAEEFARDPSDRAYEALVDQLLESQDYGARWARIWLDLARYADSSGYGSDPLRTIWRYRDWVVDALNQNMPFDEFSTEQLAGDLLPGATTSQLLATAFHRNTMTNMEGGTDDEEFRVAAVKDRVHTTAQIWLGLTFQCAQCHTHKFDPISHEEYYGFFDFFNHTEDRDQPDDRPRLMTPSPEELQAIKSVDREIAELQSELDSKEDPTRTDRAWAWGREALASVDSFEPIPSATIRGATGVAWHTTKPGTFECSGDIPETETLHVEFRSRPEPLKSLRLTLLPQDQVEPHGIGRNSHGNIVISELGVRARGRPSPMDVARLRIRLEGKRRILSLAEVEVWAAGTNVAPQGKVRQSSTGYGGTPERAIDGNSSGRFDDESVTHTNEGRDPWWELRWSDPVRPDRLVIANRTDAALHRRLDGAIVEAFAADGQLQARWRLGKATREPVAWSVEGQVFDHRIAKVTATHEQHKYKAWKSADGDPGTGWALKDGEFAPQTALFVLDGEAPFEAETLEVVIDQQFGTQHVVGRFRLEVSTYDGSHDLLSSDDVGLLSKDRSGLTKSDLERLDRLFRSRDPERQALMAQISELKRKRESLPQTTTPIMRELSGEERRETHILNKGNFLTPGEQVSAQTLRAMHPFGEELPRNRLGLARWLFDPDNPLTARVTVNRIWAHLMGHGFVRTLEDFGTQGALPNHQRVLDRLALEFIRSGWDQKALIKRMVMTRAYRRSARQTEEDLEKDPKNITHARGPRRRLEAEMIRDQVLRVSGLLDPHLGGAPIYPYQPDGIWQAAFNGQRDYKPSPIGERHRRSLYIIWRRTAPHPAMATLGVPSREVCHVSRGRANTSLQALVTLNDPTFWEAAQALARNCWEDAEGDGERAVGEVLRRVLLRPVSSDDLCLLSEFFHEQRRHLEAHPVDAERMATIPLGPLPDKADPASLAALTLVSNVVLNMDAALCK